MLTGPMSSFRRTVGQHPGQYYNTGVTLFPKMVLRNSKLWKKFAFLCQTYPVTIFSNIDVKFKWSVVREPPRKLFNNFHILTVAKNYNSSCISNVRRVKIILWKLIFGFYIGNLDEYLMISMEYFTDLWMASICIPYTMGGISNGSNIIWFVKLIIVGKCIRVLAN